VIGHVIDTIGPLWRMSLAIAVFVAVVLGVEWWLAQEDDVQRLLDERREQLRSGTRDV